MAGLIAALLGGKPRQKAGVDPTVGVGGYTQGPGPANQTGFPGSTSQTRTFRGNSPRTVGLRADTHAGFEQALSETSTLDQAQSYRGDEAGARTRSPRATPRTTVPQPVLTEKMQHNHPAEFYGGPMLKTGPGNNTAGAHPLSPAAAAGGHSMIGPQTPWRDAQPIIGTGVPGGQNVRNQIAQRVHNPPGQEHTYRSAPRPDQTPVIRGGQNVDGNVKPDLATEPVTVQNRFVFAGGGNQTWSVLRPMPYTGRGDGARGAELSGARLYKTGQDAQFMNAGMGDYGIARALGGDHKRPVSFNEPAPWTANYYDTTSEVDSGNLGQAPNLVYVSPSTGRASNSTGRSG